MDNTFTSGGCSWSRDLNPVDVCTELRAIREQVREALAEAQQASAFCRKIQLDVGEFVRLEEISRRQSEVVLDDAELLRLAAGSIGSHLSAFENFIIGRVREELESNAGKDIVARLDACVLQLEELGNQQREQGGRLEALVAENAHKRSAMRKEVQSYAVKIWDRILALEEEVRSQPAAAAQHCADMKSDVEAALSSVAREVISVLSALSESLEVERRVNEEEQKRWFVLLGRAAEKMRSLEDRNEVLTVKLGELQQAAVWNQKQYHAAMGSSSDLGHRLDRVAAVAPEKKTHEDPSFPSTRVDTRVEKQLHELQGELHALDAPVPMLQAEQKLLRDAQEANAADVARLRRLYGDLTSGVNKIWNHMEIINQELRCHTRWFQDSLDRGGGGGGSRADLEAGEEEQQLRRPRSLCFTAAQLLRERTCRNLRSYSFNSWFAWTRGRSQLKRDKTMLLLFTKHRNQLSDMSKMLYKLQEAL